MMLHYRDGDRQDYPLMFSMVSAAKDFGKFVTHIPDSIQRVLGLSTPHGPCTIMLRTVSKSLGVVVLVWNLGTDSRVNISHLTQFAFFS